MPAPPFSQLGDVIADAFALAIVVFAVSISMAKILAKKNDYEVNANQVGTFNNRKKSSFLSYLLSLMLVTSKNKTRHCYTGGRGADKVL